MPSAWRLIETARLSTAWGGVGSRRLGGRWNSPGVAVVYLSEHLSLACLEVLVHAEDETVLEVLSAVEVDLGDIPVAELEGEPPMDWRSCTPPASTQAVGDAWVARGQTAILRVPSVVVPVEYNFLVNPVHPDAKRLVIGKPMAFPFDQRLRARRR
jgi:RES domain-containing protein